MVNEYVLMLVCVLYQNSSDMHFLFQKACKVDNMTKLYKKKFSNNAKEYVLRYQEEGQMALTKNSFLKALEYNWKEEERTNWKVYR